MTAQRLAWSVWGVCVGLVLVGLVFLTLNGRTTHANSLGSPVLDAVFGLLFLIFATVGALVAAHQPRNAIGWLFLLAGVAATLEDSLLGYATYTLVKDPGSLPGGRLAALVADAVWLPSLAAATLLLFVLFPDGRPLPRWRWLVWLIGVDLGVYLVATVLNPGPLYFFPDRSNPVGLEGTGAVYQVAVDVTSPVLFSSLALGLLALVARFRQARDVERRQMKWLVYGAALWLACTPVLIAIGEQGDGRVGGVLIGDLLFTLLIGLMPIAVGVGILRHRLYDIDVVINRTLVYGALTVMLVATYLGSVLVLRAVLRPVTGSSDLAVAGSTLAVAALVRPLRARIQATVDRRFYRARYDAARTMESFAARLRHEVDLETVGADLSGVVSETVHPAHVSVWLRGTR
jgi:hypothetical protein